MKEKEENKVETTVEETVTPKKKSKKGIVIAIIVIAAILVLGAVVFFGYHAQQLALLTVEAQKASSTKMVTATGAINKNAKIDMEIKTSGNYAIVEETLKNYLNEALTLAQGAEEVYNQDEIKELISITNIKKDGPDFVETKAKIAEMKKAGEEYIDKFIALCKEENLLAAIDEKPVSNYYKELYKRLATDEDAGKELEQTVADLEEAKTTITQSFDYLNNIIEYLSNNKSEWTTQGNRIVFYNQAKLNEYNKLVLAAPGK